MSAWIAKLWRGELPAARVFWEYAIGWGTLLNLAMSGAALVVFMNDINAALGLLLHFSTVPYNALMAVAVWRSAARLDDPSSAGFFRAGILLWFALMLLL